MIVGWQVATSLYTDLALDALQMAIWRRQSQSAAPGRAGPPLRQGCPYRAIRNTGPWRGLDDLEIATVEYIDWYYNRRLHGELGHVPPAEYEALHAMIQPVTATLEPDNPVSIKPRV